MHDVLVQLFVKIGYAMVLWLIRFIATSNGCDDLTYAIEERFRQGSHSFWLLVHAVWAAIYDRATALGKRSYGLRAGDVNPFSAFVLFAGCAQSLAWCCFSFAPALFHFAIATYRSWPIAGILTFAFLGWMTVAYWILWKTAGYVVDQPRYEPIVVGFCCLVGTCAFVLPTGISVLHHGFGSLLLAAGIFMANIGIALILRKCELLYDDLRLPPSRAVYRKKAVVSSRLAARRVAQMRKI